MADIRNDFSTRVKSVERKHARMAHGYECRVGQDGLITIRPKRRRVIVPLKGLVLLLLAFICFKGLIMAWVGDAVYELRIDALNHGPVFEQVGAFVMQADPITRQIAGLIDLLW